MPLVMVMTTNDDLIVHTPDYNSPIAAAQALGTASQSLAPWRV